MKILLCGIGSRGDLQPLIALALEFKSRGHEVIIVSEDRIRPLVEDVFHLPFRKISGDSAGIVFEPEFAEMLAKGKILGMMRETSRRKELIYDQALRDWEAALADAEFVVTGALCLTETFCMAEKRGVPWVPVIYGATYPTSEFPNSFVLEKNWFGWLNRLSYTALFWGLWKQEGKRINKWRVQSLGLPELWPRLGLLTVIEERHMLCICAFPEIMIPTQRRPADWGAHIALTGFASVPPTDVSLIPEPLSAFLASAQDASAPVIYLGFGSMPAPRPEALMVLAERLLAALPAARAVLCAGWTHLEQEAPAERLLVISQAPHDYLFPRCRVIVHHAGMGTCAAAMLAGVPSVCAPVMLDQPANARHLQAIGVCGKSIPFAKLTEGALIEAVSAALADERIAERARQVRDLIGTGGEKVAVDKMLEELSRREALAVPEIESQAEAEPDVDHDGISVSPLVVGIGAPEEEETYQQI